MKMLVMCVKCGHFVSPQSPPVPPKTKKSLKTKGFQGLLFGGNHKQDRTADL